MSNTPAFKFPQPKPFDGKPDELSGASKAREFMAKCLLFFEWNSSAFTDDSAKVKFVLFLCEDAAYTWAASYIDAVSDSNNPLYAVTQKWVDFKAAFLAQFSSVDQEQTATRQLARLRQDGKVSSYAARFRELASQTKWNDESKIAVYYNGLRDAVKGIISTAVTVPDKYEDYVNWTIKIGDRLDMASAERSRPPSSNLPRGNRPRGNLPFNRNGRRQGIPTSNSRYGLSSEETQRYMQEKRCFKCHKEGHRANDPRFHPESDASGRGAPSGNTSGIPTKTGNATFGNGGPIEYEDSRNSFEEPLALEATSFRPSGSRLPWREYEDVTIPSARSAKN